MPRRVALRKEPARPSSPKSEATRDRPRLLRAGMEAVLEEGLRVPISGDCMDPVIPEGAEVRMERCPASALRPGDVVLLERGGRFVLHRYLARVRVGRGTGLLTKSDRRRRPDAPWPPGSLVGRLAEITRGGITRGSTELAEVRYRPSRRERLAAALLGLFWGSIAPFLRDARDALRRRRKATATSEATADEQQRRRAKPPERSARFSR